MTIKEIKEFIVKKEIKTPNATPNILLENTRTKNQVQVFGKILELQYRIGNDFLLITTEGNPLEEALHIYLFDHDLKPIDSLSLSSIYAMGIIRNILIDAHDTIHFSFFEHDDRWSLKILRTAKYVFFRNKISSKKKFFLPSKKQTCFEENKIDILCA